MTPLEKLLALGEDSSRQFKVDVRNAESLASEMAAFANCDGGVLYIGVADDGSTPGLAKSDVARINQLISNAASQLVRSPLLVQTRNVPLRKGRVVVEVIVPKGIDKPYFDKNGVIWLKVGSDKRRVNSKEELRRLFQISAQFHADELPTKAGIDRLDKLRLRDFLRDVHGVEYPDAESDRLRLLQNLNLATDSGKLNLAGVLLIGERPERIVPQFVVKAIRYPGNSIHVTEYMDTEDFEGPLPKLFENSLAFVMRNLHKVQAGRGVNAPGKPEIPPSVFEELLVNALVHRDYMVSAPIRLFVFDNRIEIVSPGYLPNNLTIEKIRAGNSNIRNPILVSYVAKGLMPYHGIGSGIQRALAAWPRIEFRNDHDGCLFVATVRRDDDAVDVLTESVTTQKQSDLPESRIPGIEDFEPGSVKSSMKTDAPVNAPENAPVNASEKQVRPSLEKLLMEWIGGDPKISYDVLAALAGKDRSTIRRNIARLKAAGRLRRIGPDKGGYWEVVS